MRLAVVDDHPLARQGIIYIFSQETNIEITGEAGSVEEAWELIKQKKPDLLLVDLKLVGQSGLELIKIAKTGGAECKFIVLTSSCDKIDFKKATDLGVDGYILKDALPEEILSAVRFVSKGRKYYDPGLMELIMQADEDQELKDLSEREMDVLKLLGKGQSNRQIAQNLYVSEYTVKKHVSQILSKLGLEDRTKAALYITSKGQYNAK